MTSSKSLLFGVVGLLLGCLIAIFANAQELVTDPIVSIETLLDPLPVIEETVPPTDIIVIPDLNKQLSDLTNELETAVIQDDKLLIEQKQTDIYAITGEYEQIKIGSEEKINVYESPDGWGYQTVEKLPDQIIYTGYGPQADNYTLSVPLSLPTKSTSTSDINNI